MKRTSSEAHVYMRRHQGAKVEYFDVSDVIYHKFSHGPVSYTLNGENVNVMLEFPLKICWNHSYHMSGFQHDFYGEFHQISSDVSSEDPLSDILQYDPDLQSYLYC